jgi:ubiquinone biosynthesis protein COQ9
MIEEGKRDALLAAVLPGVPFDGWSRQALRDGARSLGLSEAEAADLFPRGAVDMVAWFSTWADREMLRRVSSMPLDTMKVRERITAAVETRQAVLEPHKEAVRRALSLLALPQHAGLGLKLLYDTVDCMWHAAGDTATDWNFYTKRALLAGIYSATVLYWLDDRSTDSADTKGFFQRRLSEVMSIPRVTGRLREVAGRLPNPLRFFRLAERR